MKEEVNRIETIDKNMLSKAIARRMGLTIVDVMKIIDILQDEVISAIKENKKVQLNGFLIFTPQNVEGRTLVSPLDKKEYVIPAKRTVEIRVGKFFKNEIKDSYKPEDVENASDKKQARARKRK